MIVKYLGTGAAEGIPAVFCHCDVCQYARNHKGTGIDTPFAEGGTAFLRRTFLRFFFLSVSLSFACPYRII